MLDFETWRERERELRRKPKTLEDLVREGPPPIDWELSDKTIDERFAETPPEVLAEISYNCLVSAYIGAGFTEAEAEETAEATVRYHYDNGMYNHGLGRESDGSE